MWGNLTKMREFFKKLIWKHWPERSGKIALAPEFLGSLRSALRPNQLECAPLRTNTGVSTIYFLN